jgi:branched-subunit amino acid aminotransferase/4-amino-4-deoxychorismate lyase
MTETELRRADEIFITGTITEVVPIIRLDGEPVGNGKPGPVTMRLENLYRDVIRIAAT